ncbi:MAG: FAD-dependent oxidoreductase, partial [Acidimicrobiia bacterium]|nr:FAD-dependent oxidoreductase [Acidimicrobiia bacterium]
GVADEESGLSYRATNLNTLLADRKNLVRPQLYRMIFDIVRFYRNGRRFLAGTEDGTSLKEFLSRGRYSKAFIELHLIPMGASIWSADPAGFDEFPARSLLSFLDNHGLLSVGDRPQWKAIVGGSRQYVNAVLDRFDGTVRTSSPVLGIRRHSDGTTVETASATETFDAVVLACHSDQALQMLADPSPAEKDILGAIRYQPNQAVLHTDVSVLPDNTLAHSAWNYFRSAGGDDAGAAVLTYDMTELMRLPVSRQYLVSLNDERVDPAHVLYATTYSHPVFDGPAIAAQRRVTEISGTNRTHYAGAYWSFGFHEDGMASGLRVCAELGSPWELASETAR